MSYEEFKTEWLSLFNNAAKYNANQIGYSISVGRLAELSDAYPEFEERLLTEVGQQHRSATA